MKAEAVGRKTIKIISGIVNYFVLMIIVLLIAFAGYALWDSKQISLAADKSNYAVYKPTVEDQGKSFKELQTINTEVIAWLSVYGTNIDYPVTQGPNNTKYINTDAEGQYSLSGSVFLDSNNSRDFSDFNSVLYGHHMARKAMFGDVGEFTGKDMFESHRYGNLYFDERDHGIEFFAFVHTDAYDGMIFTPNVVGEQRQVYLEGLLKNAVYTRDIDVTAEDHIILLSTCSAGSTNGRDVLVGKITDEVYADPAAKKETSGKAEQSDPDNQYCLVKGIPVLILLLALMLTIRLIVYIFDTYQRRKRYTKRNKRREE